MKPATTILTSLILLTKSIVSSSDNGSGSDERPENSEYFHACSGGDVDKVTSLIEEDPTLVHSTTRDGEHCLHLASLSGSTPIVSLLLSKGADPDIRSTYSKGLRMHPLSWATYYGRHEIISLLLDNGADPNADFDLGGESFQNDEERKVTALDVVEKILLDMSVDDERKGEFVEARNAIVKGGGLRWSTVKDEL